MPQPDIVSYSLKLTQPDRTAPERVEALMVRRDLQQALEESLIQRYLENPDGTVLVVTRLEYRMATSAFSVTSTESQMRIFGKRVVILEDSEMSW